MLRAFAKKLVELFACGGVVTATSKATSASVQFVRLQTTAILFELLKRKIAVASLLVFSFNAYGAVTVNIAQSGSNVVVTANGRIKLPANASDFTPSGTPINAGASSLYMMSTGPSVNINKLTSTTNASSFGITCDSNMPTLTTTATLTQNITADEGSPGYFNVQPTRVYLPTDWTYTPGSYINVAMRMTIPNKIFSQLGIADNKSAICTWGAGTTDERIYVKTNGAPSLPTVTGITPSSGTTAGGTSVTIAGLELNGVTGIKFGTTSATGWVVNNDYTGITINTPSNATAAPVDVVVTTVGGISTQVLNYTPTRYTYVAPTPTISSLGTTSGPTAGGTSVVITGTNLTGATSVKFGTTNAITYVVNSDTQITATAPAAGSAGSTNVVVTTPSGAVTSSATYTYVDAPTITSLSPSSGPLSGGAVTINGTNLSGATVTVDSVSVAATTTATSISITAPSRTAGAKTIVVTTAGGTASSSYTYVDVPTVTGVSPSSGPLSGGAVTITGTNLLNATVTIDGVTAAVSGTTTTTINATAPSNATAGAKNIVVTAIGGTVTSTGGYTYVAAPTISSPLGTTSGTTAGGTSVVITGTNLLNATAVSFGGAAATSFTVNSATQITATTPAHAAGAGDVVVTTAGGTATSAGAYTFIAPPAPTITSLSPTSGVLGGATSVVITGTGFTGASAVTFDGTNAGSFTVNSSTQITATTPAHAAGAVSVLVTTANGTNSANTLFTYVGPPTVTSVAATSGSVNGGTSVTITGTNFTGVTAVSFGGTAATSFTVNSATQITATTPAHAAGAVSILVTATGGTNAANTLYTYRPSTATLSAMTISSGTLSPNFSSGTTSYTASVTNATSSITVTPTLTDTSATMTVAGNSVASGVASSGVTLNVGANTINTTVTAQDGATTQTYSIVVTRAALLAQATFTVSASPTTLNATTTSSTLSTSGGSGNGAVSYAMTAGSCTVSGTTASAGTTSSETCTVTATKASDGTYAAATATVNITVARRANIAAAATDASVLAIHGAQIMQSQKFVTTQIDNVANHLNGYRNNFNLRPSNFGFGVNIQMPSLGPASQALYKIKDELTPRPEMQAQNKLQSKDTQAGMKKVGYVEEQDLTPYNDYIREEELAAEKVKQKQMQDEKAVQEQIDQSQYYAANSQYERENLTYSVWTAGTIDYSSYKTGDNKETQNKLTANGLTMGIDYKLHDAAIVGAAVGVGTAWQSAVAINTNLKAKQTAVTGYGMFGFADHWVVEGLMGYGVVDFSGNRTTSDGAAQLGVNRKGETLFSSGTISKMYWVEGYKVTPFARQDVIHINLHSYAETGAADYALGFDGANFVHTTTSGGLQVSRDIFLEGAKLTPTAKIALNRIRTGGLAQNIYYADTGAAGGVYTLNQTGSYMTTQSLGLGLVYTTRAGDGFDLGWQGAMGANQYKLNGLRFAVRFAM